VLKVSFTESFHSKRYIKMSHKIILPKTTMYEKELLRYVKVLNIPNFRGVMMRDELPAKPQEVECGVLNLNMSTEKGSHWVTWYKSNKDRYYFDSFGEPPPLEVLDYLKTDSFSLIFGPLFDLSRVLGSKYCLIMECI